MHCRAKEEVSRRMKTASLQIRGADEICHLKKTTLEAFVQRIVKRKYVLIAVLLNFAPYASAYTNLQPVQPLSVFDAVKRTLENNPNIMTAELTTSATEKVIDIEEATFITALSGQASGGKYNRPQLFNGMPIGVKSDEQNYALTARKVLKTGQLLEASVSSASSASKYRGVDIDQTAQTVGGISVTFPLWRGRGERLASLPLNIAKQDYETQSFTLRFQTGSAVANTLIAYWQFKGALEALQTYVTAEDTSRKSLGLVTQLIEADELPASDLQLVEAQLSRRVGARIQGEQSVLRSWASLNEAIGAPSSIVQISNPATEFPIPISTQVEEIANVELEALAIELVQKRSDFLALKSQIKADELRAELSEDAIKPTLNLRLGAQSSVFEPTDSLFKAFDGKKYGPDLSVSLDYSYTLGMRAEKSRAAISRLTVQKSRVSLRENERSQTVELATSLKNFTQAADRYQESERQLELARLGLENEQKKLVLGLSTVIDVIRLEDRLLSAELEVLEAKIALGSAVSRLMFSSGYLDSVIASGAIESGFDQLDRVVNSLITEN